MLGTENRHFWFLFVSCSSVLTFISELTYQDRTNRGSEMTEKRSRQGFLAFLDWMSDKGLMAKATVAARKAAASRILGILSTEEAEDVTTLDLDNVLRRFTNLEGKGYTPGSLTTYQSRLRSALDDFKVYLDNPLSFRPGVQSRERRKPEERKKMSSSTPSELRGAALPAMPNALAIPIRPDTTIIVQGLPYDLSEAEAAKIANIIRAMATPAT